MGERGEIDDDNTWFQDKKLFLGNKFGKVEFIAVSLHPEVHWRARLNNKKVKCGYKSTFYKRGIILFQNKW